MHIQKIILWAKDTTKEPKVYEFERDKLNIIYGDSKTGKSALIPIIDYCLCSSDCRIPTGTIRQACEWYGAVLQVGDESLLLARRDPGNRLTTSDMYTSRGKLIAIPFAIPVANNSSDVVKNELNQLLGITDLRLSANESQYNNRPSIRDEAAFLFQPQNIIANPEALFYKLDDFDHKQKLSNAFPYFLGALTSRELSIGDELAALNKKIAKLDREIQSISTLSASWLGKIDAEITRAIELGLSSFDLDGGADLNARVGEIGRISRLSSLDSEMDGDGFDCASEKLLELEKRDRELSARLSQLQSRRHLIEGTIDAYAEHEQTAHSLGDYLGTVEWMASKVDDEGVCPICGASLTSRTDRVKELVTAMRSMEDDNSRPNRLSLDKELKKVKGEIQEILDKRTTLGQLMQSLSDDINEGKYRFGEIDRFIGELRASYKQYVELRDDRGLMDERDELVREQRRLENEYNKKIIEGRKAAAINLIARYTAEYLERLDVEDASMATRLDISNLSLLIQDEHGVNRWRYLNQMGSASNWLSYHVALSLALQKYFQEKSPVGMPSFIVYDQPSQVYFPHEIDDSRDRDKQAVKSLIGLLEHCASSQDSPCQIILTEHAGSDIWGALSGVNVVAHWEGEGEKLVPNDWIK